MVTYNSPKIVIETLESVRTQTYPNLSLVITDDCSTDKTLELCEWWVERNRGRFVDVTIVHSDYNTGISANGNRGDNACKTEWVKGIAGDDLLLPDCIDNNMKYVMEHPDTVYLFSKYEVFHKKRGDFLFNSDYSFFDLSPEEQLYKLIESNHIIAPTLFYNVDKCRALSLSNDERIPMLEDWPKWINALKKGVRFAFMDKTTVLWRWHRKSISNANMPSPVYWKSLRLFYYLYQRDELLARYGTGLVERELEEQMEMYEKYYRCRRLLIVRIYYSILFLFHKMIGR